MQTVAGCNFGVKAPAEAQPWNPVSILQPGRRGPPSSHKHQVKLCSQGQNKRGRGDLQGKRLDFFLLQPLDSCVT